ncbi:MAG: formylglycine-generating enzyme family protein, partial [Planctomycetota bacterium]
DKYCVSCHDGSRDNDGAMDLRGDQGKLIAYKNGKPEAKVFHGVPREELVKKYGGVFEPSYLTLRSYVRVGGLESDLRLLEPAEYGAETCELVQMLQKGHHGVELDSESWERIFAWIDLNAPCHGTWKDVVGVEKTVNDCGRRRDLQKTYANIDENPEVIAAVESPKIEPVLPKPVVARKVKVPEISGWPFDEAEARSRQQIVPVTSRSIDLGGGVSIDMVLVPAGEFVMGDVEGHDDELPLTVVRIEKPFWMSRFEVTNEQFGRFDSFHDSRYQDKGSWMFNEWDLGWDLNRDGQPVVRINWEEAIGFCKWVSEKTGSNVSLPTEAQWEWGCRAGTNGAMSYGDLDTDFSTFANMADYTMRDFVYDARDNYSPDLVPRDGRFNDGMLVSSEVGSYRPNAWGLYDMHGNVWEWTVSSYEPYPYRDGDGRNDVESASRKVVRGGSWYDRPKRCRSGFRLSYPRWQRVYNVGFRLVIEADNALFELAQSPSNMSFPDETEERTRTVRAVNLLGRY